MRPVCMLLSILDELSADFGQVAGFVSDELSHDADGLGGINGVARAWSEEVLDTSTRFNRYFHQCCFGCFLARLLVTWLLL